MKISNGVDVVMRKSWIVNTIGHTVLCAVRDRRRTLEARCEPSLLPAKQQHMNHEKRWSCCYLQTVMLVPNEEDFDSSHDFAMCIVIYALPSLLSMVLRIISMMAENKKTKEDDVPTAPTSHKDHRFWHTRHTTALQRCTTGAESNQSKRRENN